MENNKYENLSAEEAIELAKEHPNWVFIDCEGDYWGDACKLFFAGTPKKILYAYQPFSAYTLTPVGQPEISVEVAEVLKSRMGLISDHVDDEQNRLLYESQWNSVIDSMAKERDV